MNDSVEDFFEGTVSSGAPGFQWGEIGTGIRGVITDLFKTVVTEPAGPGQQAKPKLRDPSDPKSTIPQLNITLQTDYRNWDRVYVDRKGNKGIPTNPDGTPKPPSEDTGERRIFCKYDMRRAVGQALFDATGSTAGGIKVGGTLAVKYSGEKDTGQVNALPLYEARYAPPAPSDNFDFGVDQGQAPAPATPPPPAQPPAVQQPAAADPFAVPTSQPAATDPFATTPQSGEPPF